MNKLIQIAGDVAIDHFYLVVPQKDEGENWKLFPSLQTTLLKGGAYLLAQFTVAALEKAGIPGVVSGQADPGDPGSPEARKMIQGKVMLAKFTDEGKKESIRVKQFLGYSTDDGKTPEMPSLVDAPEEADLLLLDDAGNGFRNQSGDFPGAIDREGTLLVYKMSRPLAKGLLWEKVSGRKGDWVLVLKADDIRECSNVHVTKALSWERTAMEMAYQLKRNPALGELKKAPFLVILFGSDGALLVAGGAGGNSTLVFDPANLEDGFISTLKGQGLGTGSVFTACLSARLLREGISGLTEGIKDGLTAMRNLLKTGFIADKAGIGYPIAAIMDGSHYPFSDCTLPVAAHLDLPDPHFWRILDDKTKLSRLLVTRNIVKMKSPGILTEVPVGKYSKLQTFDRSEIEQYGAIRNLIVEYLDDPKPARPLCIAVFGPPGSGKSFGIKQLLGSLGRNDIPTMTFNISQYASYNELISDFHKVRDRILTGAVPVAFFDEFDSEKEHFPLGWLKYFLSPMQDGEFKEGDAIHPIGKSVFVFAGGTRSSFHDFENNIGPAQDEKNLTANAENRKAAILQFREAKGPDFVSRLRGFIDIAGPNPNHRGGHTDGTFMIRRAKILRETFAFTPKTSQLFSASGELQIDGSVLRAMLNIPEYKHGNRSMIALLDMSRLAGKRRFDLSALPTPEQLNMHVDEKVFMWLAACDRFYSLLPAAERFERSGLSPVDWENQLISMVAEKIHLDYQRRRRLTGGETPTTIGWKDLPENKKKSNMDAAAEIPVKLALIGHGIMKIRDNEPLISPDISDDEIEMLARYEHERWCREQMIQGWRYGTVRNDAEKIHPDLVPWEQLPEQEQDKDREAVMALPWILKEAGYILFREEANDSIDPAMIREIAVALHHDYCMKRREEGQTAETNPNLVSFAELSADLKEANFDSARTIPRKLKLLGLSLRKTMPGADPELPAFTVEEIEKLSIWEHARWNWHKILQGWVWGPEKDEAAKTHPCIVPWRKLPESIREYDRENVRLIPVIIKAAGYEVKRMN